MWFQDIIIIIITTELFLNFAYIDSGLIKSFVVCDALDIDSTQRLTFTKHP